MANPFVKAWKYLMALFGSKVDEYADPKVQIQQAIEDAQRQHQALTQQASLDQVSTFSPVVAENLAASAVVAVILSLIGMLAYIWVRFGSFRFSTATVIGVAFNVIVCCRMRTSILTAIRIRDSMLHLSHRALR
jgi:preprotein translocase subunit SecF